MSDQVREQVRQRYAAAAEAVTAAGSNALTVVDAAQCCVPGESAGSADPAASCCHGDTEVGPIATPIAAIEVFEPALCCNTGVCGDDVDQALVTFSADLDWAVARGGQVVRHNLANDPMVFAENDAVKQYLQLRGSAGLPLVLVNGVTVLTGAYPDRALLARWAGLSTESVGEAASGTVPAAAMPRTAAPAGVPMLQLAETGNCCSGESSGASGCC